jgi:hypothetical protein
VAADTNPLLRTESDRGEEQRGRRVVFDEYRTFIDIPFVSFSFRYWDRHYRDRPWFDDLDHWGDREPEREGDRMGQSGNDDDERRDRRNDRRDNEGMRCGTEFANPSYPGSSRGRRMQMNQEE